MPTYDVQTVAAPMPNLDNLRKQAKQYLRWHRERYYPVAAAIRAALPRYRQLDDRQVLDACFRLSDAQELVARRLGFAGWQALKAGPKAMTPQATPSHAHPILSATVAQLFVSDIAASCTFFATKLGFVVDFTYGDPPFYGAVKRDNARLALRLVCEPVFVGDIRQREHLLSASLEVNTAAEIKQLFRDFQAAGVNFHQSLTKEPWGARNFIVEDPDGNLILFAGPAD
jgi:catechol 2,3-dioxygenase-like lactoylglutathione lyase family enzyme